MADYPAILPLPSRNGYGIDPDDATERTPMESGPARVRRRFSAIPSTITVRWFFTETQLGIFEAWHHYIIADGEGWFNINLANGMGVGSMEARFKSAPKKAIEGGGWNVSAQLEVRSMPMMSEAALLALL